MSDTHKANETHAKAKILKAAKLKPAYTEKTLQQKVKQKAKRIVTKGKTKLHADK